MSEWSVYIIQCRDGSFYTGISKDVIRRLSEHNSGKGAKYTRSRRPCILRALRGGLTKSEALRLEHKIKQLPKDKKIKSLMTG